MGNILNIYSILYHTHNNRFNMYINQFNIKL